MSSQKKEPSAPSLDDNEFEYLLYKIEEAELKSDPFTHLEIKEFLKEEHFQHITNLYCIETTGRNDKELIKNIQKEGYKKVGFPGTFNTVEDYISYRNGDLDDHEYDTNETAGIVFRLSNYDDDLLRDLFEIFNSKELLGRLCSKFNISSEEFDLGNERSEREKDGLDTGIQKYLDGYEISPHPDTRKKALTWMLNLNPGEDSEEKNIHTHYMEFEPSKKYVGKYWEHNHSEDRCWVPWDWATTVKKQTENNSVVFFSPSDDTLHAVKTDYDHYNTQRTQLYGNLWYKEYGCDVGPSWDDFVIEYSNE